VGRSSVEVTCQETLTHGGALEREPVRELDEDRVLGLAVEHLRQRVMGALVTEFDPALRAAEVGALAALHRVEEVRDIVDQSLATASEYGSPYWVMDCAFWELRAHGHLEESIEIANRAVDWCRGRPQEAAQTEELRASLATALYFAERWDEANALFEELAREDPEDIDYMGPLGTLAARRGDQAEAGQSPDGARAPGPPSHVRHGHVLVRVYQRAPW